MLLVLQILEKVCNRRALGGVGLGRLWKRHPWWRPNSPPPPLHFWSLAPLVPGLARRRRWRQHHAGAGQTAAPPPHRPRGRRVRCSGVREGRAPSVGTGGAGPAWKTGVADRGNTRHGGRGVHERSRTPAHGPRTPQDPGARRARGQPRTHTRARDAAGGGVATAGSAVTRAPPGEGQ